ncbi:MAG: hypothetical protein AAFX99_14120 [Myxococcota bacterium]
MIRIAPILLVALMMLSACQSNAPKAADTAPVQTPSTAQPSSQAPAGSIQALLGGVARMDVATGDQRDAMKRGSTQDAAAIATLLKAANATQVPTDGAPRCMTTHTATFYDASGAVLGTVAMCASEQAGQASGFYLPAADSSNRKGIAIADGAAFKEALAAIANP